MLGEVDGVGGPRRGLGQQPRYVRQVAHHGPHFTVLLSHEVLVDRAFEEFEERPVVIGGIDNQDGMGQLAKPLPGDGLQ